MGSWNSRLKSLATSMWLALRAAYSCANRLPDDLSLPHFLYRIVETPVGATSVANRFAVFTTTLILLSHSASAEWYSDKQAIMGTEVSIELWSEKPRAEAAGVIKKVMAEMRRIDQHFSPYIESSELSILNRHASEEKTFAKPLTVSPELFKLLYNAKAISELSDGAFDITFASIAKFYDYRKGVKPNKQEIARQLPAINYQHIVLDGRHGSIRFKRAGVRIDLGGIAKGYAVDQGIEILSAINIKHAIVSAGGDSRLIGDRRGRPWLTGIKDPRSDKEMAVVMPLENTAISTSGDYERFFLDGDKRYHHILHPKTGDSAREVRSVTVLGEDTITTDALSTTVFVLGVKPGLALVNRLPGIDAVIIDNVGKLHYSAELERPE